MKKRKPTSDAAPAEKRRRAGKIIELLIERYGSPKPALKFRSRFQLAVAVTLSAQTTDVQVNKVTPALFEKYPTAEKMAQASVAEIEALIKSVGLAPSKASYLSEASRAIVDRFGGKLPGERVELMSLAGIGRKSANVILSVGFGVPAFAVDTHVGRVCRRLGLATSNNPDRVEAEVTELLPPELWLPAHLLIITHGRQICSARAPKCEACPLASLCDSYPL